MVKQFYIFLLLFISSFLLSCSSQAPLPTDITGTQKIVNAEEAAFYKRIQQIDAWLESGQLERSEKHIIALEEKANSDNQRLLLIYARTRLAIANDDYLSASDLLNSPQVLTYSASADNRSVVLTSLLKADILEHQQQFLAAAHLRVYLAPLIDDEAVYLKNHQAIWQLLNQSNTQVIDPNQFAGEQDMLQWLQLNRIVQNHTLALNAQLQAIENWQREYPRHPAAIMPPENIQLLGQALQLRPKKIAIILPTVGKYSNHGTAIRDGFMQAWYSSNYQPELTFYIFDDSPGFINVYNEAVFDGADMVIGPLFKEQVQSLYELGESLPVPTIALNRLDNGAESRPDNLYEFSLSIDDEIQSLITLAQHQQLQNAMIIHQADSWTAKAAETFNHQWQEQGFILASESFSTNREQATLIQNILHIDKSRQRNIELQRLTGLTLEFEPRRRQDVDFILLITRPEAAASLRPLLAFYYASGIPIYATSSVYRGYSNPIIDNDLSGVHFTDIPLVISNPSMLSQRYQQSPVIRMYAMGMDAFALSERASLMAHLPAMQIAGASGTLSMKDNNIVRQTAYGRFSRGKVYPVELPTAIKDDEDDTQKTNNTLDR